MELKGGRKMNEQINVLKPYDVYGDNLQSLFRTVDWLQDYTKRHVFDTKNLKVLSYYSARKLNGTYEVSFWRLIHYIHLYSMTIL